MKKYFLLYNDNTCNVYVSNLIKTISKSGPYFEIIVYDKKDIDNEFLTKNSSILNEKRGGGYWLWKPYIINKTLEKLNDGDLLFYLDSKYIFTEDFTNLYLDYIEKNDILIWKNKPNEGDYLMKKFCKMDVILKCNMFNDIFYKNVIDCWAGAIVLKKTKKNCHMMKYWLNLCCNYENITDSPSKIPNSKFFNEHRHDQSLLSIILYKHNIPFYLNTFPSKYLQNLRQPY